MHIRRCALIVEDEPFVALDLEDAMLELGFYVCGVAPTQERACSLAASEQPDVVLMDVCLEGGREGIEAARRNASRSKCPEHLCYRSRYRMLILPKSWQRSLEAAKNSRRSNAATADTRLDLLVSGKVRIGEDIGSGWIDKTAESIERAKRRLAQLNELLTEEGKTTVN
jgi:CheY-like chemotaxis protein